MYADDHEMYVTGKDHETVGHSLKIMVSKPCLGIQRTSLLAKRDKFQSLKYWSKETRKG